jgi:CDP-diacylglycerol--serine O-phosphatidyltransferase
MKFKQHIPNFLTTMNLASGLVSITLVLSGDLVLSALFIFLAALFDYLDGTAARLLDARSEIGKQLDSLADVVSFGVAPGLIMFVMIAAGCAGSCNILEKFHITPYFGLLIPVCSALRLAKFNIDVRQEENFIGLPTPANALFFASIPLVILLQPGLFSMIKLSFLADFLSNTRVLAILSVFFSYLLISDFRIFSMKFKSLDWKSNRVRYLFLILSVLMLILFSLAAVPMIIVLYLVLSLVFQRSF